MASNHARRNPIRHTRRDGTVWAALAAAIVTAGLMTAIVAFRPVPASRFSPISHRNASAPGAASFEPSKDPKIVACERIHKICNPAAYRKLPLIRPDAPGADLMTRRQVLSRFRQPGSVLTTEQTTYGHVHATDPSLAASDVIFRSRMVWVITTYFLRPATMPDPLAPVALERNIKISTESTVVDAATGQITDYCLNCAAVPRQAP